MKIICLLLSICLLTTVGDGKEHLMGHPALDRAQIGIYIVEKGQAEPLYSRQCDTFFVPASVVKLVTGIAALNALGENHCFHTDLAYEGAIGPDGVLHGNVWIRGGGDPTLSLDMLEEWERTLAGHLIRHIEGKLIIDASCLETGMASPYWLFEDLGNYYGAGPSGLTIHRNHYRLTFKPGSQIGDPAEVIQIDPPIPGLVYHNEVTTGPAHSGDQVVVFGSEYAPLHYYRGTVPIDQTTFTVKAAMPDPPLFCAQMMAQKLRPSQGFQIIRDKSPTSPPLKLIHRYSSPALKEIVRRMNVTSDNLYAQHLLKSVGQGKGSEGAKKIEQMLTEIGIPSQIRDGAGLARNNMLTPKGTVELLTASESLIYDTLPEIHLAPDLIVRAKTGSMGGIFNLAGFLKTKSGKELIFAIFCNNYNGSRSELKEEIAALLKEYAHKKEKG